MVSPQKEHGYVGISNEIWDEIIRRNFTKRQKDILLFILRMSYGCNRKIAFIPKQKDFALCGVGESHIKKEIDYLINCKVLANGESKGEYLFNKNYELWQVSPVFDWDESRFKELIHINLMEAKRQHSELTETVSFQTPDDSQETYQNGMFSDSKNIPNQQDEEGQKHTETVSFTEENQKTQEEEIMQKLTETVSSMPVEPNTGVASEAPKKVIKKEKNKDLLNQKIPAFEIFWSKYPRKVRKKDAIEMWLRLMKLKVDPELLIKCAENYAAYCRTNVDAERFILHAATFLHPDKERYSDYMNPTSARSTDQRLDNTGAQNAHGDGIRGIPFEQRSLTERFTKRS